MLLTSEQTEEKRKKTKWLPVTPRLLRSKILSIDEIDPCTLSFEISRFTSFEFFDHLRRRDFHFLLCVIIAVTQILDRLIIQIV